MLSQMLAVDRQRAEHYTWGAECDGWHLVRTARLSLIEERIPPGRGEVAHHHRHAQQFFYVLSGEAAFHLDGHTVRVGARQGVHVPAGVPHRVVSESSGDLWMVVVSEPPSHGDRVIAETR